MRFWQAARRRAGDESGGVTIEGLFWTMGIFLVFGLVVDSTALFYTQSSVLRAVQDGNRNMSIGRFRTEAEVEAYVTSALAGTSPNAVAVTTVSGSVVTTRVTVPAGDLQLLGMLAPLRNLPITVQGRHYIEDYGT